MGSVRRGLILACLPLPAWAGACDTLRPDWDSVPVSSWIEAVNLFASPLSLILLLATAVVLRFRSPWGGLMVCLAWSFVVSALAFLGLGGEQRTTAMAEGCIGPPTVYIAAVAALCVITVLYTGKPGERD